jgi:rod shape determining protein RodA
MMPRRMVRDRFGVFAVVVVFFICGMSLLTQSHADSCTGENFYDRHIVWFLIGMVFFFLPAAVVDLRLIERLSYFVLGISVLLLILTAFFGTVRNDSRRWLELGITIQASEIAKLGIILALARFFHQRKDRQPGGEPPHVGPYSLSMLWKPALLILVPASLTIIQPDLGTTLLMVLVGFGIILNEGVTKRGLAILALSSFVLIPMAWKYGGIKDYQKDRVVQWINPDWYKMDPDTGTKLRDCSLQSEQAICAIGAGQFWGSSGDGECPPYLEKLPELHTDMIIAGFAAKWGFAGVTLLLLLYWLVVYWAIRAARESRDRFCKLVAVGVALNVGLQVFVNVGMVAGLLPVVGLPLPILSYGGSAMVTMLFGLGLVLNITLRRGRL